MKLRILGCSAGIAAGLHTTSFLLDQTSLIDCGSGVGNLNRDEMLKIEQVFLTHSHLDHSGFLPLLADAVGSRRQAPLKVHALESTITILKQNMFNFKLWPDYTVLPTPESPFLVLNALTDQPIPLPGGWIGTLPVDHTVPGVAYQVHSQDASLVFSGDTTYCEEFWRALNNLADLRHLIVETTFLNVQGDQAKNARHMTANLLARGLQLLKSDPVIYITHMEPGQQDATMLEVKNALSGRPVQRLYQGQEIEF